MSGPEPFSLWEPKRLTRNDFRNDRRKGQWGPSVIPTRWDPEGERTTGERDSPFYQEKKMDVTNKTRQRYFGRK